MPDVSATSADGSPGAAVASPVASASPATDPCPPIAVDATVMIRDFEFDPTSITVAVGSTVSWTNDGLSVHTVTADDGSFDSKAIAPGTTFEMTFDTPGTYAYHCVPHPSMTATVIVE
jgi:plastocyanin